MTIGEKIKKIRKEKKMTQPELAKRIGVSVPTLQRYENGVTELKASMLNKIADALDVNFDILFSGSIEQLKIQGPDGFFSGSDSVNLSYYAKAVASNAETPDALKSITIEHNGEKYNFTVTSKLPNEDIEKTVKVLASLFVDKVNDDKK